MRKSKRAINIILEHDTIFAGTKKCFPVFPGVERSPLPMAYLQLLVERAALAEVHIQSSVAEMLGMEREDPAELFIQRDWAENFQILVEREDPA